MFVSKETKEKITNAFSELIGTRYVPIKARGDSEYNGDEDEEVDFPYVEDPEPYITHRPIESKYHQEQGPEELSPPEGGGELPPEGVSPGGIDPGMMPPQEEPLSADEIGRVYELKKIYSRMTSIESYLSGSSDQSLIEVRKNVSKAIDLFEIVITNFPEFKEKVDDIIVNYYKFIEQIYRMVRDHYKQSAKATNEQKNSLVLAQKAKGKGKKLAALLKYKNKLSMTKK